jgi:hypothetical protein
MYFAAHDRTIDWKRIEAFSGYGNLLASVVFVGMEEGLPPQKANDHNDALLHILCVAPFSQLMDLSAAHVKIDPDRFNPAKVTCQDAWRPMCDIMLRRSGVRWDKNGRRTE